MTLSGTSRRSSAWALATILVQLHTPSAHAQDTPKIEIVPNTPHGNGDMKSLVYSRDGTYALSATWDSVRLWSADSGRLIRTFVDSSGYAGWAAFSPDTATIVTGWGNALKIWDLQTGRLIRTIEGHAKRVLPVAYSPDGKLVASGSEDRTVKLWEAESGRLIWSVEGHSRDVTVIAFSPNGSRVLSAGNDKGLKLWDTQTGQLIRSFEGHTDDVRAAAFSPDGRRLASGGYDRSLKFWNVETGEPIRSISDAHARPVYGIAFSPDGTRLVSGGGGSGMSKLWDADTGQLVRTLEQGWMGSGVGAVAISPDGGHALTGQESVIKVWDVATGKLVRQLGRTTPQAASATFSPDGQRIAVGLTSGKLKVFDANNGRLYLDRQATGGEITRLVFSPDGTRLVMGARQGMGLVDDKVRIFEQASGRLIRAMEGHTSPISSVAYSADGRHVLSASWDRTANLWDAETGKIVRSFDHGHFVLSCAISRDGRRVAAGAHSVGPEALVKMWDAASGDLLHTLRGHSHSVVSVEFSPDGHRFLTADSGGTLKLWDTESGRLLNSFEAGGHLSSAVFSSDGRLIASGGRDLHLWGAADGRPVRTFGEPSASRAITSVGFSPDGAKMLSSETDGTVKIWKTQSGELLATLFAADKDDWLLITLTGFFNASSAQASEVLSVVRGLEATSIGQVYEHLYRPDLIEHLLKGDPEGKYTDEASKLNLQKIMDSGPAPQIETIPGRRTERTGDQVRLALRVVDTGGGVGDKVVWRVNGVVQGDVAAPPPASARASYRVVTQTLRIDPSKKNLIEVTAYNAAGLLATEPFRLEVDAFGATTEARPRMHVLAAGVSTYAQKDWNLQYAVQDARTLATTLKSVASGLYGEVKVTTLLDGAVTAAGLEAAIDRIAAEVRAADVFVLFIAGHGRNVAGTYYFLPQDLKFEGGRTVMSHGISQDQWQRWLARIPAQKSILVFDTCESSGAAGLTRGDRERETAMDRLRHATGRSVITAARQAAYEGYNGHGVLTYAILEALTKPESGGEEEVDLYRLAAHVDRQVPLISERLFGVAQRPHNRVEGNFPIGIRKAGLTGPLAVSAIPKTPTHVLVRQERVRESAREDAPGSRVLDAGSLVRVVEFIDRWAVVAREGQKLGYVPDAALLEVRP